MPNPYFSFKQFRVFHDKCAMKVGTDGVLLGSWVDCNFAENILDVGTGSGLIALMLAQRSNATIEALDIDENACIQARYNVEKSSFHNRIRIIQSDFQTFESEKKYDLIVSNPPYFTNSLQTPDKQRTLARHNQTLPFDILIKKAASLLTSGGKIALILPAETNDLIDKITAKNGLFLCRKTFVSPKPETSPKRILSEYVNVNASAEINHLFIEKERHVYSEEFNALTDEFYL